MATRLNNNWCEQTIKALNGIQSNTDLIKPVYKHTTADTTTKRFILNALLKRGIAYKVIPHGAGLVTITTETDLCPKCGGRGRC